MVSKLKSVWVDGLAISFDMRIISIHNPQCTVYPTYDMAWGSWNVGSSVSRTTPAHAIQKKSLNATHPHTWEGSQTFQFLVTLFSYPYLVSLLRLAFHLRNISPWLWTMAGLPVAMPVAICHLPLSSNAILRSFFSDWLPMPMPKCQPESKMENVSLCQDTIRGL